MGTTHRKDITSGDIRLLARLSSLFCRFNPYRDDHFAVGFFYDLGDVSMIVPTWYRAGNGWQLAGFRTVNQKAVAIETADFRRVCKYLQCSESVLVGTLFRLSMIGVMKTPDTSFERPKFRMPFSGYIVGYEYQYSPPDAGFGFVIEYRRIAGNFRSE